MEWRHLFYKFLVSHRRHAIPRRRQMLVPYLYYKNLDSSNVQWQCLNASWRFPSLCPRWDSCKWNGIRENNWASFLHLGTPSGMRSIGYCSWQSEPGKNWAPLVEKTKKGTSWLCMWGCYWKLQVNWSLGSVWCMWRLATCRLCWIWKK